MARNSLEEVKYALLQANINLTNEQINKLINGEKIELIEERNLTPTSRCSGVKLKDFGNGCGLYSPLSRSVRTLGNIGA